MAAIRVNYSERVDYVLCLRYHPHCMRNNKVLRYNYRRMPESINSHRKWYSATVSTVSAIRAQRERRGGESGLMLLFCICFPGERDAVGDWSCGWRCIETVRLPKPNARSGWHRRAHRSRFHRRARQVARWSTQLERAFDCLDCTLNDLTHHALPHQKNLFTFNALSANDIFTRLSRF